MVFTLIIHAEKNHLVKFSLLNSLDVTFFYNNIQFYIINVLHFLLVKNKYLSKIGLKQAI